VVLVANSLCRQSLVKAQDMNELAERTATKAQFENSLEHWLYLNQRVSQDPSLIAVHVLYVILPSCHTGISPRGCVCEREFVTGNEILTSGA
jgi:hypothetical protein